MPFELIRRKEGEESQKQKIWHSKVQISINDWGHLCIREFDNPQKDGHCTIGRENCQKDETSVLCCDYATGYKCEHYRITRADDEHLLVFDKETTDRIMNFIFSIRSSFDMKWR